MKPSCALTFDGFIKTQARKAYRGHKEDNLKCPSGFSVAKIKLGKVLLFIILDLRNYTLKGGY